VVGLTVIFTWLVVVVGRVEAGPSFQVSNLVTDDPVGHPAPLVDPQLVNAWGISYPATGPFWVSDNAASVATLYSVSPTTEVATKVGFVNIPGEGSVTGQVFNGGNGFNGNQFLFASEDGTISGWRGSIGLGGTAEILVTGSDANVDKGLAVVTIGGNNYVLATNFRAGTVDVFKGNPAAPNLSGTFTDPNIPSGYAPFGIQVLNNTVYVTYALQDSDKEDDVAGAGHGFVDAFDVKGNFLGRIASQGSLNSPWGLAIAPTSFGSLAGDLLVGNFGDGRINAFALGSNTFLANFRTRMAIRL